MFCPQCGKQIQDGSKFCFKCGSSLAEVQGMSVQAQEHDLVPPSPPAPPSEAVPQPTAVRGFVVNREDLEARYASLPDDELTALHGSGLTDVAQSCLDQELNRRAIKATSEAPQAPAVTLNPSRGPNSPHMTKTVTTTDDTLQIFAARDLDSNVLARIPKGVEVELGDTSTVEGRGWIQATPKDGASGFVLAPSVRGHTTFISERTILAGVEMAEVDAAPSPAPVTSWLSDILKGLRITAGVLLVLVGVIGGLGSISGAPGWSSGPEAWFSVLLLIGSGIAIWVSEKAKPIGGRQYRWGTYVGIMSGIGAAAFFLSIVALGILSSGRIGSLASVGLGFGIVFGLVFCMPYAVASVGILRRKRFGVVTFLAMWSITVLGMFVPFLSMGARSTDVRVKMGISAVIALLVLVAPNYIYFAKRWKIMSEEGK
jgi:hypothetical protein